jgi:hypothetical protein
MGDRETPEKVPPGARVPARTSVANAGELARSMMRSVLIAAGREKWLPGLAAARWRAWRRGFTGRIASEFCQNQSLEGRSRRSGWAVRRTSFRLMQCLSLWLVVRSVGGRQVPEIIGK